MKLSELGEDQVITALTRALPGRSDVRVGVGDDCAVIGRSRDLRWTLLKTDATLEGIHFLPGEDLRRVGWKALCRAISDIAAMGGVPEHALVTIAVAPEVDLTRIKALYAGLARAARRFGVAIVGGEMSRSPGPLFVSIALTGFVERKRCVLRSDGKPGDALFVTGRLGGSIRGWHLDFLPRLHEARWLVTHFKPRAMMDLSDGLAADLPRLALASGCGYELDESQIPRKRGCTVAQALSDGEDYELLFAIEPRAARALETAWRKALPRLLLTQIGALSTLGARRSTLSPPRGFDHFA